MVDWCVVDGSVVDGTGVVERGVVNAVVASISFNSVAVLGPLLLFLIEHHAFERFGPVVCHGSPLQIEVEGWEGVVKLVTHLVPAMRRSLLLLLLLASNHPEGKKCNTGLKMKFGQKVGSLQKYFSPSMTNHETKDHVSRSSFTSKKSWRLL